MTQELIQAPSPIDSTIAIYSGASMLKITEDEQKKLLAEFDEKMIEVRPDGLIYLPQTFWRQRLNQSFGIGQWVLVVKSSTKDPTRAKLYLQGILMVRGCYVAESVGEAEYHETNPNQSWASVWESAKSDCITRCCKDLGIASELWQPQFTQKWVSENAVKVFVETEKNGQKKTGVQWRKKTAAPLWNEKGIVPEKTDLAKNIPQKEVKQPEPPKHPAAVDLYTRPTNDVVVIMQMLDKATTTLQIRNFLKANESFFNSNPEMAQKFRDKGNEILSKQKKAA